MNIEDARELVSQPNFLKKMLELNCSAELFLNNSYLSDEMKDLIKDNNLNSYALSCIINRDILESELSSSFLVLKNEYDNLLLTDTDLLKVIVFYVGSCTLSKIFTSTAEKKRIDLYKVILGEKLFNFVLKYGRYAPYDEDLGLKNINPKTLQSADELSKLVVLYGLRAILCIATSFSDPLLKESLTKKLIEIYGEENVHHKLVQEIEKEINVKRIYSLIRKVITYKSGR